MKYFFWLPSGTQTWLGGEILELNGCLNEKIIELNGTCAVAMFDYRRVNSRIN
jgi:hypothetical protein